MVKKLNLLVAALSGLGVMPLLVGAQQESNANAPFAVQASNGKRELAAGAFVPRIDMNNKDAVARAYHHYYYWRWLPDVTQTPQLGWLSFPIESGWTGNVERCEAGTLADSYQVAAIRQANYFRAMAGLSPVTVGRPSEIKQAQAVTLVLAANNILTHNIPSSAKCYSQDAADGAAKSNLNGGLSAFGSPNGAIGYMDDGGSANFTVGHRQWLLDPLARGYAYGDAVLPFTPATKFVVNGFDAWYVFNGGFERIDSPEYIVWPVAGWNPSQVMPLSNRWSFACELCGFEQTTISMTKNGVAMAVPAIEYRGRSVSNEVVVFNPVGVDYGYDAATGKLLGWPKEDAVYTVSVKNVRYPSRALPPYGFTYEGGYVLRDFSYTVKVFDVERHLMSAAPVPRINYADMWAGADGAALTLHPSADNTMSVTWKLADSAGLSSNAWVMVQGASWLNKTTLQGRVTAFNGQLRPATSTGATPSGVADSVVALGRDIGLATIVFSGDNDATVSYVLNGVSNSVAIKRGSFGEPAYLSGMNFTGLWRNADDASYALSLNQQYSTLLGQLLTFDGVGGGVGAGTGEARSMSVGRCEWGVFDEGALMKNASCRAPVYDAQRVIDSAGTTVFARKVRGYVSMRFETQFTAEVTVSLLGAAPRVMKMTRETGITSASKATLLNRSWPESNGGASAASISGLDSSGRQ